MKKFKDYFPTLSKETISNIVSNIILTIATCVILVISFNVTSDGYSELKENAKVEYEYTIYRSMSELHYNSTKEEVINEINNYIDSVAPSSALNGIALFEACDEYNIDIVFVMAQAQLESHFGTTGVASKTNSVWNVLAYDGRSAEDMNRRGHGYDHPDKSIKPYLKLLSKKYMSDVITEYDLMKKYVSSDGHRYASDKNYESKLTGIYDRIISSTNIFNKYQEYKKYKMILQVKE